MFIMSMSIPISLSIQISLDLSISIYHLITYTYASIVCIRYFRDYNPKATKCSCTGAQSTICSRAAVAALGLPLLVEIFGFI